jgi:dihydrofolate reductase
VSKITYAMGVSLDGFIAGPNGELDWGEPDEELHRFHNERVRELGAEIMGRRLYETMLYWETAAEDPALEDYAREFAEIWKQTPRLVFSRTLTGVEGNARLASGEIGEEVARLKEEIDGDIAVGGAELATEFTRLGLIDEYGLFVHPIVLGAGIPYLRPLGQPLDAPLQLRLAETKAFESGVTYLRYER